MANEDVTVAGMEATHAYRVSGDGWVALVLVDYGGKVTVYPEAGESFSVVDGEWLAELRKKLEDLDFEGHQGMLGDLTATIRAREGR